MKRSELRQIIHEGIAEKFFAYLQNTIQQDRKRRVEKEVSAELAKKVGRLRDAQEDLERFVKNDMSKEEMIALAKKLRGK